MIKKIFNNSDKILKGIAIFNFIVCIVFTVIYDLFFLTIMLSRLFYMQQVLILKVILFPTILIIGFIVSIILSIPLYGFAEIITGVKEINKKLKE